jgi:hypothetical protein
MVRRNHAIAVLLSGVLSLAGASALAQTSSYDLTPVAGTGNGDGQILTPVAGGSSNAVVVSGSVAGTSATFTATGPNTLQFGPNTGSYTTFSGYTSAPNPTAANASPVLAELTGANLTGGDTLNVSFASAVQTVSFDFALGDFFAANGNDVLDITTNTGKSFTATATLQNGDFNPEGTITLSGVGAFSSISLTAANPANTLVLADLSSSPTPEPSSLAMMAAGLALALVVARRRR